MTYFVCKYPYDSELNASDLESIATLGAVDETVIHLDDERWWLYTGVDPEPHDILHLWLVTVQTMRILSALQERHYIGDTAFLVDSVTQ